MLVLTPSSETLFIPKRNTEQEHWTGPRLAPGDPNLEQATGFKTVQPASALELSLMKWSESISNIYTLTNAPQAELLRRQFPELDTGA